MTPELWSAAWFSALASIVLIDLVLAGDNALVIGLAARKCPPELQRKVILWGTVGAIVVRAVLTGAVVWLLKIPGFLLVGGLALAWIGWKLTREPGDEPAIEAKTSFRSAVQTIIAADAVMGVDNVLAVGGAAHGSFLLVIIGLLVSVPIVVWGSTLVLRLVSRFPAILWLGAGVLGWTAAKMIASEALLAPALAQAPEAVTALHVLLVGGLIALPILRGIAPRQRARVYAVAIMLGWVTALGAVEDRFGWHFHSMSAWGLGDELLDLVRWLGWVPLVLWFARSPTGRAAATRPAGRDVASRTL